MKSQGGQRRRRQGSQVQLARLCTAQVFQYSSHQSSRVVPSQGVSQQMAVTCLRKGLLVVCPEPCPGLTGAGGAGCQDDTEWGTSLPGSSAPLRQLLTRAPQVSAPNGLRMGHELSVLSAQTGRALQGEGTARAKAPRQRDRCLRDTSGQWGGRGWRRRMSGGGQGGVS